MPFLKILVVEDYEPFRQAICSSLRQRAEFQVIETADGLDAVEKAKELQPDLVLFDISLPKLNGIESAKQVHLFVPHAKVMFVSQESSSEVVREVFRLGAQGYVHKQHAMTDLFPAIEAVLGGKQFVSSDLEFSDDTDKTSLPEGEERFRLVANTAPVMIWMSGVDKLCTYFNRPWLDFTGRPIEAEIGNGWAEGVHPEDLMQCLDTYGKAFDLREPFKMEYRLRRHDREYRWLFDSSVPRFNTDGSFAGYIGSAIDITERKLAQDRLEEYQRAVDGLEEMIVVVDREYRYLIANNKFLKMRNMTKGQVVGRFAHEVLNKGVFEAVVKAKLDECFRGEVVRYEMKYTYPELGERDILVSYFPVEGASGVDRVVCIVQDITDRKRIEEALKSMNRKLIEAHEEERTRIARELHDDISQRLALLAITLHGLNQRLPSEAAELMREMADARKQVANLGNDIQALSHRLHSPRLEFLGLTKAATAFCKELSERQGVRIDFYAGNLPPKLAHEVSLCLFRILQEALQNAIKHSGSHHFQVSLMSRANDLELAVHDSGCGFEPAEAINGPGLGLTSMRERLKLVNGELSIDSQPGSGTTIRARVPLIRKKARRTGG
jgi:PAS domain S-box-containing protein